MNAIIFYLQIRKLRNSIFQGNIKKKKKVLEITCSFKTLTLKPFIAILIFEYVKHLQLSLPLTVVLSVERLSEQNSMVGNKMKMHKLCANAHKFGPPK